MRVLLIFLSCYILCQIPAFSQISKLPYHQDFENSFLEYGSNVEFLKNWVGNQVNESSSRIFHSGKYSKEGKYALSVQPVSSFDGEITIDLDLSEYGLTRIQFYGRTVKKGTGSRPVFIRIATSVDGGLNFIKGETIGDDTTFPNQDTQYGLYIYDLPPAAAHQKNVKLKLEILYTAAFGEGTAARFVMDDFSVYEKEKELNVVEVLPINEKTLQIIFNQEVDKESGENTDNYSLQPSISILQSEIHQSLRNIINLTLSTALKVGDHKLVLKDIFNVEKDQHLELKEYDFLFTLPPSIPDFNELIITEIMADPDPTISQPLSEYIELYNNSDKILSLQDIIFSDANSSTKLPDIQILPGEYLLVVPKTKMELFEGIFPLVVVSSWPSLNVGGDELTLSSADGKLIFSVSYDKSWYNDPLKNEGGWSLEMIDVNNPCGENQNWAASKDNSGGTPARPNSIQDINTDTSPPVLIEAIAIKENKILLKFNEKILPEIQDLSVYEVIPEVKIESAEMHSNSLKSIILTLAEDLEYHLSYKIQVNRLKDCAGNSVNENIIHFAIPEPADSLDIIINEILFNARTGGVKFVEIYNNSERYINLKNWQLGNSIELHNSTLKLLTKDDYILNPKSYLAISQNSQKLKSEYPRGKEENFFELSTLPGYTISEGTVVLHNEKGKVMDYFSYSDDYHSSLLRSTKGVSLERISANGISNHQSNWQSAASTIGFATPGYKNSQSKPDQLIFEKIKIEPKVFIPENTGFADYTSINFKLVSGGYYGSLDIFDTKGNLIKRIAQNEKLPAEGFFTWDGTDENNRKVRIGYYLVYFEIYNLNGNTEVMKETVVVGKRF